MAQTRGPLVLDGHAYELASDEQGHVMRRSKVRPFAEVQARDALRGPETFQDFRAVSINNLTRGLGLERIPTEDHKETAPYQRFWSSESVDTRWPNGLVLSPQRKSTDLTPAFAPDNYARIEKVGGYLYYLYIDGANTQVRTLDANRAWGTPVQEAGRASNLTYGGTPSVETDGQYTYTARYVYQGTTRKIVFHRKSGRLTDSVANIGSTELSAGLDVTSSGKVVLVNLAGTIHAVYSNASNEIAIAVNSTAATFVTDNMPVVGDNGRDLQNAVVMNGPDGRPKIYVGSKRALYEVDPGNETVEIVEQFSPHDQNFQHMLIHQGAIYYSLAVPEGAPFALRKLSVSGGARVIENVSVPDDSLPSSINQSEITGLASLQDQLYLTVGSQCVFCLMPNGSWHCVGMLQLTPTGKYEADPDRDIQVAVSTAPTGSRVASRDFPLNVSASFGAYNSARDFNLTTGHDNPAGGFTDGTHIWSLDFNDNMAYAYRVSNGGRDSARDFSLNEKGALSGTYAGDNARLNLLAANTDAVAAFTDGTYYWVVDGVDKFIYCYRLADDVRQTSREISLVKTVRTPVGTHLSSLDVPMPVVSTGRGVMSDDFTIWALDGSGAKAEAYDLSTKARDSDKDFDLSTTISSGFGNRQSSSDFIFDSDTIRLGTGATTNGVAWDGVSFNFVTSGGHINRNAASGASQIAPNPLNFAILNEARNVQDSFSDGTTMWCVDDTLDKALAITRSTGRRDNTRDIDLSAVTNPVSGFATSTRIYILGSDKLYSFSKPSTGRPSRRPSTEDIELASANDNAPGVLHSGTTAWVVDSVDKIAYAYNISTRSPDSGKNFSISSISSVLGCTARSNIAYIIDGTKTGAANAYYIRAFSLTGNVVTENVLPSGGCVAGDFAYVIDSRVSPRKLRAYRLSDGGRVTGRDINLVSANSHPIAAYSDDINIYVLDSSDTYIYCYRIATKARDQSFEINMVSPNDSGSGLMGDGTTIWVIDPVDDKAYGYGKLSKGRTESEDFALNSSNSNPRGAITSGSAGYVFDTADKKVYCYDLYGTTTTGNERPSAAFTDGTYAYVADWAARKVFAYSLTTRRRVSSRDFGLTTGNSQPQGAIRVGSVCYLADRDRTVYCYQISGGRRVESSEWTMEAEVGNTASFFTDGTLAWAVDAQDDHAYAYEIATGTYKSESSFDLDSKNGSPHGAFVAGSKAYITDSGENRIYVYNLAQTVGLSVTAQGGFSDGTLGWVVDSRAGKAYAYRLSTGARVASRDITLGLTGVLTGGWSDGTYGWVFDNATTSHARAYRLSDGSRQSSLDITITELSSAGYYGFSDGTTGWIVWGAQRQAQAYSLSTRAPDSAKNFSLNSGNATAAGGVASGTLAWVFDSRNNAEKAFAYSLSTSQGSRTGNIAPVGGLTDGIRGWVIDDTSGAHKAYCYNLNTKLPVESRDFNLDSGNTDPVGGFSDYTTGWVIDGIDRKVYAYSLADGSRDTDKEFSFDAANTNEVGGFTDGTTAWIVDSSDNLCYAYTLDDGSRASDRDITISEVSSPVGAFDNNILAWIIDGSNARAYCYDIATGAYRSESNISLSGNSNPVGGFAWHTGVIWVVEASDLTAKAYSLSYAGADLKGAFSDGDVVWIIGARDRKAFAYSAIAGAAVPGRDIDLVAANSNPVGGFTDGTTAWIVDDAGRMPNVARRCYAYTLADGTYQEARNITITVTNSVPVDGFTDGTYAYIVERSTTFVYAFRLSDGVYDVDRSFNMFGHNNPWGGFTDRTHAWIVDGVGQFYGYNLETGARAPSQNFAPADTSADPLGASDAVGDEYTVWVVDGDDSRAYAYVRPTTLDVLGLETVDADLLVAHRSGTMSYFPLVGVRPLDEGAKEQEGNVVLPYLDLGLPGFEKAWYFVRLVLDGDFDTVNNVRVDFDGGDGAWAELGVATPDRTRLLFDDGGFVSDRLRLRLRLRRDADSSHTPVLKNLVIAALPEIPTFRYVFNVDVGRTAAQQQTTGSRILAQLREAAERTDLVTLKFADDAERYVDIVDYEESVKTKVGDAYTSDYQSQSGVVQIVAQERFTR